MVLVKVESTELDDENRRVVKFVRYFKQDAGTAKQVAPFGVDSAPPAQKNVRAVHGDTESVKDCVILGYINEGQVAEAGETRLYAVDDESEEVMFIHLKADGTVEIGGDSDNLVKYIPLDNAMQVLAAAINTELGKIATGIAAGGGSYTPTNINIDISLAKAERLKIDSETEAP